MLKIPNNSSYANPSLSEEEVIPNLHLLGFPAEQHIFPFFTSWVDSTLHNEAGKQSWSSSPFHFYFNPEGRCHVTNHPPPSVFSRNHINSIPLLFRLLKTTSEWWHPQWVSTTPESILLNMQSSHI